MEPADLDEFEAIMTGFAKEYGTKLSGPGMALKFEALKQYAIEDIRRAVVQIMRTRVYTSFPPVA